jgi:heme oxygenase
MEELASKLDENTRQRIIEEGINVFKLNNSVIRTIRSADEVLYHTLIHQVAPVLVVCVAAVVLFVYAIKAE